MLRSKTGRIGGAGAQGSRRGAGDRGKGGADIKRAAVLVAGTCGRLAMRHERLRGQKGSAAGAAWAVLGRVLGGWCVTVVASSRRAAPRAGWWSAWVRAVGRRGPEAGRGGLLQKLVPVTAGRVLVLLGLVVHVPWAGGA